EFAALRARIGMVPQDDIVQLDLTVAASLGYAAELRFPPDVSRSERRDRVEEVMAQLGLTHRRDTVINALSGGQRKRVSVATELLTRPALLFLDEPTSGLDPGLERSLMQTLRELADGGRTVVCVTHSVESLQLCDRVLFLAPGGHVAYFGPPAGATTYFERPDLQTVFQALSAETGWTERFERSPVHERYVATPLAAYTAPTAPPADTRAVRTRGWARQFWTFSRRYARSLVADRRNLFILCAAAPVLGLIFLLRFPTDQLTSVDPDQGPQLFSQASAPLMILALAMTQLGINLSAREIVRELPLFRRERAVGLSITAYVASKFAVLAGIGALQALICVGFALAREGGPDEGAVLASGRAELVIVFFMTWLAGMTLGLLCSALAASEQRLTLVLPALIGLQTLAVTGTAIESVPSVPVLDQTEYVASASWGFTAAASTVQLNQLNAFNSAIGEIDIEAARNDPRGAVANALDQIETRDPDQLESLGNPDFNHDARAWWRAVLVLAALSMGALAGTVIALRRYDPL
ncbi:MAG: transport system ATP-binding/permease protein, partial [Gaiellales bacterium]|nr:transport system ATP-binding/permease protein [Gaiellales bacterium]